MYDTIKLSITKDIYSKCDFLNEIPQYLSSVNFELSNQFGQKTISGYLDNLKINISEYSVSVSQGSLGKFFLGDNFKTLTKNDTKNAIQKISDILHLPFNIANVTRLHFGQSIIMNEPEMNYILFLGDARYYNRLLQNNGLYYKNSKRQLLFYGKHFEQYVKKQSIPELYRNKNVLRYELQYNKRLKEQLNISDIKASLLYDSEFYKKLVINWKNNYLNIQKINNKLGKMQPTGSTKEFINNLALLGLNQFGQSNALELINNWQKSGKIDKNKASRLRQSIKQLNENSTMELKTELISELEKKIRQIARFAG